MKKTQKTTGFLLSMLLILLAACSKTTMEKPALNMFRHIRVGFAIDSVADVDNAAKLGINVAITYGTAFTPSDAVGAAMMSKGMHEIDAGLASELFYYECHRTHTVAPPPPSTTNAYCATDEIPAIDSKSALLAAVDAKLQADAANPLIVGYWILDDWASWDGGSAKTILQGIHRHIQHYTPTLPAICGFGLTIQKPAVSSWDPHIALNYSNEGCDMIGIYSYATTYPSYTDGSQFDFQMKRGLKAAFQSLEQQGWSEKRTPLIGIGQAFAGPYGTASYQPMITSTQMYTQMVAFCQAGASSIGWYAWNDSHFGDQTLQPMNSTDIQNGIRYGIAACQRIWSNS